MNRFLSSSGFWNTVLTAGTEVPGNDNGLPNLPPRPPVAEAVSAAAAASSSKDISQSNHNASSFSYFL